MKNITLNGKQVTYELERKPVKNINIRIRRDGTVYVSAHKGVSVRYIEELLEKKSEFIINALERLGQRAITPDVRDCSGEFLNYLGAKIQIKITPSAEDGVFLREDALYVFSSGGDREKLIKDWLYLRCGELFSALNFEAFLDFSQKGFKVPLAVIKIKEMKSRWGSCNPKSGNISLNMALIHYPPEAIKAVVRHEYAHFIHPDHSKRFYECLTLVMPDYKKNFAALKMNRFREDDDSAIPHDWR